MMFVVRFSVKNTKRLFFAALALIIALAAVCVTATVIMLEKPRCTARSEGAGEYSLNVEKGRYEAFFSQLGLNVDEAHATEKNVIIPAEFDEVYTEYNELQKAAGLDLEPFKGKQASLLTFPLNGGAAEYAVILVCDGQVIGGHLTDGEYGSEMLPLTQ